MTLIEVIVAVLVFSIITPMIAVMLSNTLKSFTAFEASQKLRKVNRDTLLRCYYNLSENKRLFQNTADDLLYLNALDKSGCPRPIAHSRLPIIASTASMDTASPDFVPSASIGNMLLFARYDQAIVVVTTPAASGGANANVRTDIYRFMHIYLSSDTNDRPLHDLPGKVTPHLVEWASIRYADYSQLVYLASNDLDRSTQTIFGLWTAGVRHAWDTTARNPATAFWKLHSNGTMSAIGGMSAVIITSDTCVTVTDDRLTGIMGGGFRYGFSYNSAVWPRAPKQVPLYATFDNTRPDFPSGFETFIVGNNTTRNVVLRMVLVAQGTMPSIIGDDQRLIVSARDTW